MQVDQLVMEVIDEQTQEDDEGEGSGEDDEDDEEEEEEEKPKKKAPAKKAPKRKATPSGSEGSEPESDEDSEEERAPSDGGGSDYEPDEPVKISRGKCDMKCDNWCLLKLLNHLDFASNVEPYLSFLCRSREACQEEQS